MSMLIETPQTQIASYLVALLHKRIDESTTRRMRHDREAYSRLRQLRGILPYSLNLKINNFLKEISNKFLEDWLWRFKDFFYMTEDVFDDLDIIVVLPRDKRQGDDLSASDEQMLIFNKAMEKLLEVIDAATGLLREIKDFTKGMEKFEQICSRLEKQQVTSSELPTLPYKVRELKGRAEEEKKILETLLHRAERESESSPVMINITGPVGIGKTDLVRAVYNSAEVEAEFDVRAWIYNDKVRRGDWWLTLQSSESASVKQPSKLRKFSESEAGDCVLETIETEIEGKKVLIVLDNLMTWFYDDLFRYGAKLGSRIIATSQFVYIEKNSLLSKMQLDGLEENEYLKLFKECALGDRKRNEYPEFEGIVKEIAKRFGGNPLAAVMIGRHLKWHQCEDRWRKISSSNLGMIDPTESNIISKLRHSYEKLPGEQKQCYLACSLFPKNYAFEQDQLFAIWDAIGCWPSTDRGSWTWEKIESFFVSSEREDGERILHAIFHEFADYICDGEFFRLEDEIKKEDDIQISDKAQHVYVTANNFVKVHQVLQEKTHLRSLVIRGDLSSEEHKSSFMGWLEEVLQNLEGLRLLMISVLPTGKLPDAIGGLRHLRYLELPIDTITEESTQKLPSWLSDDRFDGLRQLQNLKELREAILKKGSLQEHPTSKSSDPSESSYPSKSIEEL